MSRPGRRRVAALAVAAAVGLAGPRAGRADPLDEFGFGSRAAGLAGAEVANARGVEAAHYNPAGLALAEHPEVLAGYGYGAMQLSIDGRDSQVLNAHGASLGLGLPFRLGRSLTAAVGVALYLPDQFIARVQLIPPTEPHFILLDNDPHRIVIEPVTSLRIGRYLALGLGASMFADAAGDGVNFNVGVVSGEKVGESAIDFGLPIKGTPLVGVLVTPTPAVRIGATYRGQLSLDLALDILANVSVAGVVTGDALIALRATNYFTPQRVTGGVAVDLMPDLTVSGELTWANWAAYPMGIADLRVLVALDITPPLVQTDNPPPDFDNTLSGRLGIEYRHPTGSTEYALRAGYAYLPSPVPEQVGLTSFADNDRHVLSLGLGTTLVDWRPLLTRPIELALAFQWHHLVRRLTVKDAAQFPGEAFSSAGDIFHLGTSATIHF